jgi:hypothetical protein
VARFCLLIAVLLLNSSVLCKMEMPFCSIRFLVQPREQLIDTRSKASSPLLGGGGGGQKVGGGAAAAAAAPGGEAPAGRFLIFLFTLRCSQSVVRTACYAYLAKSSTI